jgi:hypothetical protein
MGRFVGAALCTHIPRLFILDPAARRAYMGDDVTTMYQAMEALYADKIAALDFTPYDTLLAKAGANPANITSQENRRWDERILGLLVEGKHAEVLALSGEYKRVATPEGRWAHYLSLAGALGGEAFAAPGQLFGSYEAALGTGQANVWFDLSP